MSVRPLNLDKTNTKNREALIYCIDNKQIFVFAVVIAWVPGSDRFDLSRSIGSDLGLVFIKI